MLKPTLFFAVLLIAGGCQSDEGGETCMENCMEGVTIALHADEWRDGAYEINAIYTTEGVEHEVWCMFTLPGGGDAHCTSDSIDGEAPALDVGETVFVQIPGAPTSIDLTLYDAHAFIERYTLMPEYVDRGCDEKCKVATLSASFAGPQDAGLPVDLTDGTCIEGDYLGVLVVLTGNCGNVMEGFELSLGGDGALTTHENRVNVDITTMSVVDGCSASVSRTIAEKTGQVIEELEGEVDRTSEGRLEGEVERRRFDAMGQVVCQGVYEVTLERMSL